MPPSAHINSTKNFLSTIRPIQKNCFVILIIIKQKLLIILVQSIGYNLPHDIKILQESNRYIFIPIFRHIISPKQGTCTSDYSLSVTDFLPVYSDIIVQVLRIIGGTIWQNFPTQSIYMTIRANC